MPDRRWMMLAILVLARAATGFQFQSVGSSAKLLMQGLGFDYTEIGMLLGAYLLPGVIVALPAGLLGQRFREKTLALAGLALMTISGVAFSCSESFPGALVARTFGGAGATIVVLVATKMTTDWFENREIVLAMSILQMSWPFGAMLALPIQAYVAQLGGWPAVMMSAALGAGAAFCAFFFAAERVRPAQGRTTGGPRVPLAALLPITIAGIIWGAMNLACILFFSYAPPLLVAQGSSATAAASLTSVAIWLTILAIPTGGYLVQRSGRPLAAIVVCTVLAAATLTSFVAGFYPTTCCLLFGVAVGPMSGAILALPSMVLNPRDRPVGFGVFYTCFYLLMAVGPSIAGYLQDAWRSPSAGLVSGAAVLAAIVPLTLLFASMAYPLRRDEPDGKAELPAPS